MRFRKNFMLEGNKVEDLKYKTPFYPITPIVAIILYVVVIIAMIIDPTERMAIYTGVPTALILYIGYVLFSNKNKKRNIERAS